MGVGRKAGETDMTWLTLTWTETEDHIGNTIWTAESSYDGFFFRIYQKLAENRIEFWDGSDSELNGGEAGFWLSIAEAKSVLEAANRSILQDLD
jgi:hypothetical protein